MSLIIYCQVFMSGLCYYIVKQFCLASNVIFLYSFIYISLRMFSSILYMSLVSFCQGVLIHYVSIILLSSSFGFSLLSYCQVVFACLCCLFVIFFNVFSFAVKYFCYFSVAILSSSFVMSRLFCPQFGLSYTSSYAAK